MRIVSSNSFFPFINWAVSVRRIDDIFSKSEHIAMLKKIEPLHHVHEPWIEQTKSSSIAWEPVREDTCTGPYGGPKCSPSSKVVDAANKNNCIVDIFLFIFPLSLLSYIANQSRYYTYEEWVQEVERINHDGKTILWIFAVPVNDEHKRNRDKPSTPKSHWQRRKLA